MKNYLDLIPISAKRHKRQGKMTVICIMLAVFLVTVIFGMAEMGIRSQQYQEIKNSGDWHVIFENIDDTTGAMIQARPEVKVSGWYGSVNESGGYTIDGKPVAIAGIDRKTYQSIFLSEFSEGDFPESNDEVALSEYAKTVMKIAVGDTIQIQGINEPLTVTGFVRNSAKQMRQDTFSVMFTIEGFREHIPTDAYTEQLVVQLSPYCNMQKVIGDIIKQNDLTENQAIQNGNLLVALGQSSNSFILQLYGCAMILFILVLIASILMITSSLNSNVMQRTEFFGMLCCIGATKKQIMRFVRREGLQWCKFAIPIGLFSGVVVVWILCAVLKLISPVYFKDMPTFEISWISIICGIIVGILTVLLSAQAPAKKASRVSPLAAVSGNAFDVNSVKGAANTHIFKIDTSLGIHHATGNKKNLFLMSGSFALSIILFLAFSTAIDFMNHAINPLEPYTPDVSIVSKENTCSIPENIITDLQEKQYVDKIYGRMFAYDLPVDSEPGEKKINLISYEDNQFSWAEDNLLEGSVDEVKSKKNTVLAVYNTGYSVHVGDTVQFEVNGSPHEVVIGGILSKSPFTNNEGTVNIICTEEDFREITGESEYTIVDMQVKRGTTDAEVSEIRSLIGDKFTFSDRRQSNQEAIGTYYSFTLLVYGFLVVIALITVFNVMNSISMSVSARMKQYGAMRAIGMSDRQLLRMVTGEAAAYAAMGSLAGCIIGLPMHKILFERMVTARWGDAWGIPVGVLGIIVILVILTAIIAVHRPAKIIHNMSIVDTIGAE